MTISEIETFVYDWLLLVNPNSIVILGSQNAPRPVGNYIVIHRPFGLSKVGSTNKRPLDIVEHIEYIDGVDEFGEPIVIENKTYTSSQKNTTQYTIVVSIEDVNGDGSNLQKILNTLEFQSIQDFFRLKNISCLNNFGIVPKPNTFENNWYMGSSLDFTLSFSMTESEVITWIEHTEITGDAHL